MSIYSEISRLFGRPLADIGKMLNYPESTICILSGNENELKTRFSDVYANIQSCCHHWDRRTPMQYAMDLAASWVMEDW